MNRLEAVALTACTENKGVTLNALLSRIMPRLRQMDGQSDTSIDVSQRRVRDALATLRDYDGAGEQPQWPADVLRQAARDNPALLTAEKATLIETLCETPSPQTRVLLYNIVIIISYRHPQIVSQLHGQILLDLQADDYPRHGFISKLVEIEALSSRHVPVNILRTLLKATESHPNPGVRHRAFTAVATAVDASPRETASIWDTLCTLATGDEQPHPPSLYRQAVRYLPDEVYAAIALRHETRSVTHTESFAAALLEKLSDATALPDDADTDHVNEVLLYHGYKSHIPENAAGGRGHSANRTIEEIQT